jgi:hypothetical protein
MTMEAPTIRDGGRTDGRCRIGGYRSPIAARHLPQPWQTSSTPTTTTAATPHSQASPPVTRVNNAAGQYT